MPKTMEQVLMDNLGGLQFILCQKEVEIIGLREELQARADEISNLKARLEIATKTKNRPVSGQNKDKE